MLEIEVELSSSRYESSKNVAFNELGHPSLDKGKFGGSVCVNNCPVTTHRPTTIETSSPAAAPCNGYAFIVVVVIYCSSTTIFITTTTFCYYYIYYYYIYCSSNNLQVFVWEVKSLLESNCVLLPVLSSSLLT